MDRSPIRRILDDQVLGESGLQHPSLEVDNYAVLTEIARRNDAILLVSPVLTESSTGSGLIPLRVSLPEDRANLAACIIDFERHRCIRQP